VTYSKTKIKSTGDKASPGFTPYVSESETDSNLGYLVLFQSKHSCVLTETKPNTLSYCIHTAEINQLKIETDRYLPFRALL